MRSGLRKKIAEINRRLSPRVQGLAGAFIFIAFLTSFLLFNILPGWSQTTENEIPAGIQMIARPLKDSILLRWAPANYHTWDLGNRYGYKVQRFTVLRDSMFLPKPELNILHPDALLPLPLVKWEPLINVRFAMIAAQAIYGESFIVDAGEGFTPVQAFSLAEEQQQRFSFALYASDMSPAVARASGLWFTDTRARKNEKYLYRVILDLPDSLKQYSDTAFVFTGIEDYQPLPVPYEFSVEFGDRLAFLSWNAFVHDQTYTAWIIERSDNNGRTFSPLSQDPFIPFSPGDVNFAETALKIDTLPANNRDYHYRIRGATLFGEFGPWSDIIKGRGVQDIGTAPNFTNYELVKGAVVLHWDFPVEENGDISGFRVMRATIHQGDYQVLSQELKPAERRFRDVKPIETAYYKVVAWRDEIEKHSFPFLVQQTDSIPPGKPAGLKGVVDSTGVVYLSWAPNSDPDIFGYRVFRSASGNDEFSQQTTEPVLETFYQDTISMRDLNASVYYKIFAVDQRQNRSVFSDVFQVTKPDLIAPSEPVFRKLESTAGGIEIKWVNSSSQDASAHLLYRRGEQDKEWVLVKEFPVRKNEKETSFTDTESSLEGTVRYMVRAVDNAGNFSEEAISPEIHASARVASKEIRLTRKITDAGKGEIVLTWNLPEKEVRLIRIYRATKDKSWQLFETLEGDVNTFTDYGLKAGNTYKYRIQVVYDNGKISGFSNEVAYIF